MNFRLSAMFFIVAISACNDQGPEICILDEDCQTGFCNSNQECGTDDGQNNLADDDSSDSTSSVEEPGEPEPDPFQYVRIADTTFGFGCEDTRDAGSDIMYGYVTDDSGVPLAFANLVAERINSTDNDFGDTDVLRGVSPELGVDDCPVFGIETVLTLGCRGEILVNFLDATGTEFGLLEGEHTIVIGEYGAQCGGSFDDNYSVFACSDRLEPAWGSCDALLALDVDGESFSELRL